MPIQIDSNPTSGTPLKMKAKGPIIGIDLGTTNSLVAYAGVQEKVQVLKDPEGAAMLPSVLSISDEGVIEAVGLLAKRQKSLRAENIIYSVKRLMGRSYQDVVEKKISFPFALVDDELHAQVRIKVGELVFSPIEMSAEILKALKKRAERALGTSINRAVITVPAYFDDAQRSATKAAGRLAGLEVLRVMNEPTAAALAYGWNFNKPGILAVYDLGGGTFDVSILNIQKGVYEVMATAGDTQLGGDDFDRALAEYILEKIPGPEKFNDLSAELAARLLELAEKVKIQFSIQSEVECSYEGHKVRLHAEEVENIWKPLVNRTLEACRKALEDAKLEISQIQDVLLVGGSSRMPLVQKAVTQFFQKTPNMQMNPDEAVAMGAALQAEVLEGRGEDRLLLDVIPLSLGIETMGGAVSKLLHRNSSIPNEAVEIFTNHSEKQTAFDIHVLQGERELVKDCRSLAYFKLRGLVPAPPGFHRLEVMFRVDANGILNVRARDLRTHKSHEIEVQPTFGITDDEVVNMLEAAYENAETDIHLRQLVDMRIEADTIIRATQLALKNAGSYIGAQDRALIQARLADLQNALRGSHLSVLQNAIHEMNEATKELAEIQVNEALSGALKSKPVEKI